MQHVAHRRSDEINALRDQNERLRNALEQIEQWAKAYPLSVFPEPDLTKARALLDAGGLTLDAISASAMRHVLSGIREIVRDALSTDL
jgi:hypothetical protein